MPHKAGKLTIYQEESTMTATLTLNDMTIEQASAVLSLVEEMQKADKPVTPEEARNGVELFPAPAPAPVQTAAIPAAAPAPLPAQTAPQTYTVQQLGQAARPLMENGRQQELIGLLAEFGVQSVAALPENRRADFAARLRAMGGLI